MTRPRTMAVLLALGLVLGACSRGGQTTTNQPGPAATTGTTGNAACTGVTLQATDVGITPDSITIEVMADVGSPLAPGLFQANIDAIQGFAKMVNSQGGIACRQLKVVAWDSKLTPDEAKNGIITACKDSLAMVGGNALFNPDVSAMTGCVDKAGNPTGLPDLAALANDINEECAPTAYLVQAVAIQCPPTTGPQQEKANIGPTKYFQTIEPNLHGMYMVPGDLPTTVLSATPQIKAQAEAGVTWDKVTKVSGSDTQAAYTPRVQSVKQSQSNYVFNGSNDVAMIRMRKEAAAQGVSSVKVWACFACYTDAFKAEGAAVDGTYVQLGFVPFEEADTNPTIQAYLDHVPKPDVFGAGAWQSALLFQKTIDQIVATDGPNGITRAKMLDVLSHMTDFDANGWLGKPKDLKGFGPGCFVMMQLQGNKFVRVYPQQRGTLDCNPDNVVTINLDPAAEAAKIS